ncbi:MAG: hypothetical protein C4346_02045 [Chloroflexota bacterium]
MGGREVEHDALGTGALNEVDINQLGLSKDSLTCDGLLKIPVIGVHSRAVNGANLLAIRAGDVLTNMEMSELVVIPWPSFSLRLHG